MTEKNYGGVSGVPSPKPLVRGKSGNALAIQELKNKSQREQSEPAMTGEEIEKLKKAGEIAKKVKVFAREIIKPGKPLIEIANEIDEKIIELGGKPAFPVNLSINEVAAHSTPAFNDSAKAFGLLKVDVGVQIDGYVADTAFSIDLDNNDENKKLIEAAELALDRAIKRLAVGTTLREVGREIDETISSYEFQAIRNLSGHSLGNYDLHAGVTIPNTDNFQEGEIGEGAYAIEPFATSGAGFVINGKLSGIYVVEREGNVRDSFARDVLSYIFEEYKTLPFCSRWLVKKFGSRALIALKRIEEAGIVHHYPQLIEKERKPVAQAEHTIILTKNEKIVTT